MPEKVIVIEGNIGIFMVEVPIAIGILHDHIVSQALHHLVH